MHALEVTSIIFPPWIRDNDQRLSRATRRARP